MNLKRVRQLVSFAREEGLAEIEVGGLFRRVRVVLGRGALPEPLPQAVKAADEAAPEEKAEKPLDGIHVVTTPVPGTYYEAATPGEPPFVTVGDRVEPGSVLCIIEAMKVFNEIESEVAGIVETVLPHDGDAVEYNAPLMHIRPG